MVETGSRWEGGGGWSVGEGKWMDMQGRAEMGQYILDNRQIIRRIRSGEYYYVL